MDDSHIQLAHGNGGRYMRELIEQVFAARLGTVDPSLDAAPVQMDGKRLMLTTDGFTVQPLEFPGGSIGSLAVHGTVNDLAVSGAVPRHLTLAAMIEEGLEIALLQRIVADFARAASEAGVTVVAGDTKVLRRGEGGGVYLAVTGIGEAWPGVHLGMSQIRAGDRVLVSGPVGDHGTAVLLAREQFGLRGDLQSDSASVLPLAQSIWALPGLRFMRDPTRGGLATVAHEIARATGYRVALDQPAIPVRDQVGAICDMLGYDPCFLACEGRVVAVVAAAEADAALACWRSLPQGADAAIIGEIRAASPLVTLATGLGGERVLQELEDDPLPRIC